MKVSFTYHFNGQENLFSGDGNDVIRMAIEPIHYLARTSLIDAHRSFLSGKKIVEFGVCNGGSLQSFVTIFNEFKIPTESWGFDSFEGIPEEHLDPNNIWKKGDFTRGGHPPESLMNRDDIKLVKGWFEDSLNADVANLIGPGSIGIAHFDCDTYSSSLTCWRWLLENNLVSPGTIIVYDDWGAYKLKGCGEFEIGEAMAHLQISRNYGVEFEDLGEYNVIPNEYIVKIFRVSKLNQQKSFQKDSSMVIF